mgnify:CR=1 FL=1
METISNARRWTGRILSGLSILFLLVDGGTKVVGAVPLEEGDELLLGYPLAAMPVIGAILLACVVIHLVPRLSLLGAVLLTGYLGGAVASHVRVENPLLTHTLFPIYVAALVWGGLLLRRPELRLLLPARASSGAREGGNDPVLAAGRSTVRC